MTLKQFGTCLITNQFSVGRFGISEYSLGLNFLQIRTYFALSFFALWYLYYIGLGACCYVICSSKLINLKAQNSYQVKFFSCLSNPIRIPFMVNDRFRSALMLFHKPSLLSLLLKMRWHEFRTEAHCGCTVHCT